MRLIIELVVAGLLVVVAWEKPFNQWFGLAGPREQSQPPRIIYAAPSHAPAKSRGDWMWDASRKSTLDPARLTIPKSQSPKTVRRHVLSLAFVSDV